MASRCLDRRASCNVPPTTILVYRPKILVDGTLHVLLSAELQAICIGRDYMVHELNLYMKVGPTTKFKIAEGWLQVDCWFASSY